MVRIYHIQRDRHIVMLLTLRSLNRDDYLDRRVCVFTHRRFGKFIFILLWRIILRRGSWSYYRLLCLPFLSWKLGKLHSTWRHVNRLRLFKGQFRHRASQASLIFLTFLLKISAWLSSIAIRPFRTLEYDRGPNGARHRHILLDLSQWGLECFDRSVAFLHFLLLREPGRCCERLSLYNLHKNHSLATYWT